MRKHERSPYARLATDEDKRAWLSVYAPIALVGFVQVVNPSMTHWAAVIRNRRVGLRTRHVLHGLCGIEMTGRPTPGAEVDCMTCIVRNANGPRGLR